MNQISLAQATVKTGLTVCAVLCYVQLIGSFRGSLTVHREMVLTVNL